jgi:hypothetical protein
MFLIQTKGETHIGSNPPGDDILEGLLGHYGSDIRVVRADSQADHDELTALRDAADIVDGLPVLKGNVVMLGEDGQSIEARDKDGALIKRFPGVLIYPTPTTPLPEPPAIDLVDLHRRMVALGSSLDEVALAVGMKAGEPITRAHAELLAKEVAFQEEAAKLPRVGQFGGVAATPETGPRTAPEPTT